MDNFADRLLAAIEEKNSCICVGIDPRLEALPQSLRNQALKKHGKTNEAAAAAFLEFGMRVIDVVAPIAPCVKVQVAFYEQFGWEGYKAFMQTTAYAHDKGLVVIADVKRSDIGSTAEAYAAAHLAGTHVVGVSLTPPASDAITVNAYLGYDGVEPFLEAAKANGKGLFILVKTSNPTSGEVQDRLSGQREIFRWVAEMVNAWGSTVIGDCGYSSVGAVVGATFPKQAASLRKAMPRTIFLVPGFGAQGGTAEDIIPCFSRDGMGAIINSSRHIIYAYQRPPWDKKFGEAHWEQAVAEAAREMSAEVNRVRSNL